MKGKDSEDMLQPIALYDFKTKAKDWNICGPYTSPYQVVEKPYLCWNGDERGGIGLYPTVKSKGGASGGAIPIPVPKDYAAIYQLGEDRTIGGLILVPGFVAPYQLEKVPYPAITLSLKMITTSLTLTCETVVLLLVPHATSAPRASPFPPPVSTPIGCLPGARQHLLTVTHRSGSATSSGPEVFKRKSLDAMKRLMYFV
ncbi:hypothetical protein CEXT_596441 [Caerostris extrusa]|uniref:Uncharacterized protein n=1 Tax=Caerostris extrusa TaxID=172846 RepID=A0AAV4SAN8_CAEEX|nr:hypothetical protein CEXT_596441 [Caerostris extrusa]